MASPLVQLAYFMFVLTFINEQTAPFLDRILRVAFILLCNGSSTT